ncbi:GMC family oxidoreductase [Bradyrhizobium sp. ISRA463]|nr:GMC family oxidoreductase [Bradyrhizobium sp. ISRA463]WGS20620.1 GMC family oxidoreductase [Bradyrhizobium sp. ISRA463]
MLKVRDSQTGLWAAFYLRPTASAEIRSDPLAESFKASEIVPFRLAVARKLMAGSAQSRKPDFRSVHTFAQRMGGPHAYILVISEQEAVGQGRVGQNEIGKIVLEWNISDAVVSSINRSLDRLASWLGGSLTRADGDLRTRLWSAAHHSGGCRIADAPNHGVVDRNLRVHGTNRIYVCDGSVLPSTGASNTGLTIGSLALRLADHICKTVVREPVGSSSRLPKIAVSGAGGHVGRILMPALVRSGFAPQPISLRKELGQPELGKSTLFLHLANAHGSVEENMRLQKRTAELLAAAEVSHIIVLQSFATLQDPSSVPDSAAANFGFERLTYRDPYILGKLAVEQFWTNWQRERPDRGVAFVYVPTILGPQSAWTREIANYCQGRPIWVPAMPRFFSLTDEKLAASIVHLCGSPVPRGISRRMLFDRSGSLAEAVAWDRGADDVVEIAFPSVARLAVSLARFALFNKVLNKALQITNRCLHSRYAILPVSPKYYGIFQLQSRFASIFNEPTAAELSDAHADHLVP